MCARGTRTRDSMEGERERGASERALGPTTHTCTCGAHQPRWSTTSFQLWTDRIPSASDPTSSHVTSRRFAPTSPAEPDPHHHATRHKLLVIMAIVCLDGSGARTDLVLRAMIRDPSSPAAARSLVHSASHMYLHHPRTRTRIFDPI